MTFLRLLTHRPLVTILFIYILILLILNQSGFFENKKLDNSASSKIVTITGHVKNPCEEKNGNLSFIIETNGGKKEFPGKKLLVNHRTPRDSDIDDPAYNQKDKHQKPNPGDIIELRGKFEQPAAARNPGAFNYKEYLSRQNIDYIFQAFSFQKKGHIPLPFLISFANKTRQNVIDTINENMPEETAGILLPMLIGDKSGISKEAKLAFTNAGVMHVLVVSGLNVGFCAAIFLGIFRLSGLRRRYAALFTIPFIVIYVLMAGANPPVLRAGIMAIFIILSLGLAREPRIYHSLCIAALVILIFDPQALFTASFQLSFAATIGIVYLYPYLLKPFKVLPHWIQTTIGGVFAVSLGAQLGVTPLIAYYFNKVSVIGILSNILIVPFVGLITAAGIFLYFAHFISPMLTSFVAAVSNILVNMLSQMVNFFAGMKVSVIHVASPSIFAIFIYYLLTFTIFRVKNSKMAMFLSATAIIAFVTIGIINKFDNRFEVVFLDVGNGDAIHIRFPDGQNWLIDGGSSYYPGYDPGERIISPYLWSKGVRQLDRIFVTHPHLQHYSGIKTVINNFKVKEIIFGPEMSEEKEFNELMKLVKEKNVGWKEAWAGDLFTAEKSTVSVISPAMLLPLTDDNCLVLSLDYFGHRIIFTSDMSSEAERLLVSSKASIRTTVLQIPNHGSRKVSNELLSAANPDYLVVSTGRKEFRPPWNFNPDKVYTTKTSGAITINLTKENVHIESFLE